MESCRISATTMVEYCDFLSKSALASLVSSAAIHVANRYAGGGGFPCVKAGSGSKRCETELVSCEIAEAKKKPPHGTA